MQDHQYHKLHFILPASFRYSLQEYSDAAWLLNEQQNQSGAWEISLENTQQWTGISVKYWDSNV